MFIQTAYTQKGVDTVEKFFNIQKDNYFVTKTAKFIGRGLSDTSLVVAGLVELAAFTALALIALPTKVLSKLLPFKDRAAQPLKNAILAASAAANAFKGIAGYSSKPVAPQPQQKEVARPEQQPAEADKPAVKQSTVEPKKSEPNIIWDNKAKIAIVTGALVLGTIAIYYGYNHVFSKVAKVCKDENIFNFNPKTQCHITDKIEDLTGISLSSRSIDYINPLTQCHISEQPYTALQYVGASLVGCVLGVAALGAGYLCLATAKE